MLEQFMWAGKKAQCNKKVLQQTKLEGLAFPNLWWYYQASLLENIVQSWGVEQQMSIILLKEWCLLAHDTSKSISESWFWKADVRRGSDI